MDISSVSTWWYQLGDARFVLIVGGLFLYGLKRAKKGLVIIRKIPAVDAIEDVVSRCAEGGRPISFTTGLTELGPTLYACLGVLSHVARKAARLGIKIFVPVRTPEVLAITEETVKESFRREGKGSKFDPTSVKFLSEEQFAFTSGYVGLLQREKVGGALMFGEFAAESLILAEAGQQIGATQVAATVSPEQVAFFISACDYTLIGEELFGASAYLSKEPLEVGSLWGQDSAKLILMLVMIAGICAATLGYKDEFVTLVWGAK
jgi:hypothetical protein